MQPPLTPAPHPATTRLAALTTRRRQLTETAAAAKRRRETAEPDALAAIARHLAFLATEIADLTTRITALVDADPELRRKRTILYSVPGVQRTTAHLLLAELGTLDPKALASLVGVAPFTRQSGAAGGTAHIDGGRRHVRTGLWMPTISAMRYTPVIRAFRDQLEADHKVHNVRTIACMRKLLTILNACSPRTNCGHHASKHLDRQHRCSRRGRYGSGGAFQYRFAGNVPLALDMTVGGGVDNRGTIGPVRSSLSSGLTGSVGE